MIELTHIELTHASFIALLKDGTHITRHYTVVNRDEFKHEIRFALNSRRYEISVLQVAYGPIFATHTGPEAREAFRLE